MPAPRGHPQWGHIKKGQKQKRTLQKEKAQHRKEKKNKKLRVIFEDKVKKKWPEIVDYLIKHNKQYVADQIMGKPTERMQIQGDVSLKIDL